MIHHWLQISAGQGPAECCWVVAQLSSYLLRQAQQCGLKAELVECVAGEQGGTMKSALLSFDDSNAAVEFAKGWQGTVQWIGPSMFRPGHKRKNWFVGISRLEGGNEQTFSTNEVRIERFRASGPGGQHVNKTESAIRAIHLPSGLVAESQQERSQQRNKALALARLKQLLAEQNQEQQREHQQQRWQQANAVERGNPIKVFLGEKFRLK